MTTNGATGALRDIHVVEFGQYVPGPMLGMLLADQGAHVIKVERPGGDPARSEPAFATWNRGQAICDPGPEDGRPAARTRAGWPPTPTWSSRITGREWLTGWGSVTKSYRPTTSG